MRIERAVSSITTLGPGSRIVFWTNGCHRGCPGCVSKRLQRENASTEVDLQAFLPRFDYQSCDGVTISGGEPFEQKEELLKILAYLKETGVNDILVYTGYLYEELLQDEASRACLDYIDVLIDGPYVDELNDDTNNLYGSSNQRIHYLNLSLKEKYEAYIQGPRKMQEFVADHILVGVGIPSREYVMNFKKEVSRR